VKRLEKAFGVVLFERHRDGSKPTEAGSELAALAERVSADLAAVALRSSTRSSNPVGELNVTTNDSVLVHLLTPAMAAFRELYPGVRLNLLLDNTSLNLARREADVAFRATKRPPENLAGRRISAIAWALYGPAGERILTRIDADELRTYARWAALGGNLSRLRATRFVEAHVPPTQIVYTVNSVQALADAVEGRVGVGLLPCFVGDARPRLVRLSPPIPELAADLWLLTHPNLRQSQRVRAFVDYIVPDLIGKRRLLEGGGDALC
jgi:DNA-binding transcriptional LysR family regulator